jgi:5-methylcytosine-specific restriction endonuclease McrA
MSLEMRKPCASCGHGHGSIETRNGQDCVFCGSCGKFQYNAPKTETGRAVRSVKTTHEAIQPKQRSRILNRDSARCVICGARGDLQVAHVVSVDAGHKVGLSDSEINSDENLIAACPECNLGMGSETIPLRVMIPILKARYLGTNHEHQPAQNSVLSSQPAAVGAMETGDTRR